MTSRSQAVGGSSRSKRVSLSDPWQGLGVPLAPGGRQGGCLTADHCRVGRLTSRQLYVYVDNSTCAGINPKRPSCEPAPARPTPDQRSSLSAPGRQPAHPDRGLHAAETTGIAARARQRGQRQWRKRAHGGSGRRNARLRVGPVARAGQLRKPGRRRQHGAGAAAFDPSRWDAISGAVQARGGALRTNRSTTAACRPASDRQATP